MLDITRAHGIDFLFPKLDNAVGAGLKLYGEFAPAELDLICAYLAQSAPGTFVDVGANIGAVCLPIAKSNPGHAVLAIEAHRGLAQILSANAYGNHLYGVSVLNAAAGDAAGIVDFPAVPLSGEGNFGIIGFSFEGARVERVRMCTLDEVTPNDTRFIKVDVEGHEASVIDGATRVLETIRPVWLLEASAKNHQSNVLVRQALLDADHDLYWFYSPFMRQTRTPKTSPVEPHRTGDPGVVAIPRGGENLWGLPAIENIEDLWPSTASAYGYLKRYGF
jgi:FkbM family methyltransferase